MSTHAAFLAAVAADPHDRLPRLVYADWLDEHDDPRGELVRLEDGLLDIPPADDRYWQLRERRNALRATVDADWLAAVRVGLDSTPLLAHGWPDDWKGRWRTVRVAAERLLGKDVPDVGGRTVNADEAASELGLSLSPSVREWVAFVADVREEQEGGFLHEYDGMNRDVANVLHVYHEIDYYLGVEQDHLTNPDPPLAWYSLDWDGHGSPEPTGEPGYASLSQFALLHLIVCCHGTGGAQVTTPADATATWDKLVREFGPPLSIGDAHLFGRAGLIAYFDSPRSLRVSVRSTVRREDIPPFLFELAAKNATLSGLFVPEGFEDLLPPPTGGRCPPSAYFADPAEMAYRRGNEYRAGEDHAASARWFRLAAERGHPYAASQLGYMCHTGQGIPADPAEAVRLYRQAVEKGNVVSMFNLGIAYRDGTGVEKDPPEAVHWFRRAADSGDRDAVRLLALAHRDGHGVPQDYTEAARLYRKAAEWGDHDAEWNLGRLYQHGHGVTKDYAEAHHWVRLAAAGGEVVAAATIGYFYQLGLGVPADAELAARWYRTGADGGNTSAMYNLACCYYSGSGVGKDLRAAGEWFEAAAARGHDKAMYELGMLARYGLGRPKNEEEATRWFRRAADAGHAEAKELVGGDANGGAVILGGLTPRRPPQTTRPSLLPPQAE